MGIFKLFKKKEPFKDEFFGSLLFLEFKSNPENNYFEGAGYFEPIKSDIEYFIDGDESGPTDKQKEFYKTIQEEYSKITETIQPHIENEFRNWKDDFTIKNFIDEFTLVSMKIPREFGSETEWEMGFETKHDENHLITAYLKGYEVQSIGFDG
jgi:hypothetical protein